MTSDYRRMGMCQAANGNETRAWRISECNDKYGWACFDGKFLHKSAHKSAHFLKTSKRNLSLWNEIGSDYLFTVCTLIESCPHAIPHAMRQKQQTFPLTGSINTQYVHVYTVLYVCDYLMFTCTSILCRVCLTYPKLLLVPGMISDEDLTTAAKFRMSGRLPVISWRCVVCASL